MNSAQIAYLKAMSKLTPEEIEELQRTIAQFFARKADEEMERLWKSGEWDEEKLASLENSHFRTPYK